MKYINVDKLKAEIERRMNKHWEGLPDADLQEDNWTHNELCELGAYKELEHIEDFLNSLQQEHPKGDLAENIEMEWDSFNKNVAEYGGESEDVVWLNWFSFTDVATYFYELGLNSRKGELEQQEVNLEEFTEKMDAWKARFNHPDDIPIKATMAFTARMFYQYPDVARQWYEQLPKATMD